MPTVWNSWLRARSGVPTEPGLVQPDGTTILLSPGNPGGILSAAAGAHPAVTAVTGVAPISSSGGLTPAISVANATSSAAGVVQPDNTSISVAGGILSTVAGIRVVSTTLTATQINAMFAAPILLVAGQGAGTLIVVDRWTIGAIFGTLAFTGGGNIALYYGAISPAVSVASQVIVPTILTTFAANQVASSGGAAGSAANTVVSSIAVNGGLYISNMSAPFAVGTGSSMVVTVQYHVLTGVS